MTDALRLRLCFSSKSGVVERSYYVEWSRLVSIGKTSVAPLCNVVVFMYNLLDLENCSLNGFMFAVVEFAFLQLVEQIYYAERL